MLEYFDRASRACIFDALRKKGINEPMITLLIELYSYEIGERQEAKHYLFDVAITKEMSSALSFSMLFSDMLF